MNDGVKILLERMKTHPEEFYTDDPYTVGRGAKWNNVIDRFRMHLSDEDRDALNDGLAVIYQEKFTEIVLEALVDPKSSKDGVSLNSAIHPIGTPLGGATLGQSWVNQQLATAQAQSQVDHMKAHLKALQQDYADVFKEKKEHKTLYGRLKNYLHND